MPSALSSLMRVLRTMVMTSSVPSQPASGRAQHQHQRRFAAGEHEGQDDAGQGRVRDGVAEQALLAQHGKGSPARR